MTQTQIIEHIARLAELRGKEWDIEGVRLAAGQGNPFPKFAEEIRALAAPDIDGGADYEAKASETTDWILDFMEDECSLLPECVSAADRSNIANAIVNALAGSAAAERERCETIARAEAKRAVGFPRGFYAAENIANAIAALAEPKGEGR